MGCIGQNKKMKMIQCLTFRRFIPTSSATRKIITNINKLLTILEADFKTQITHPIL